MVKKHSQKNQQVLGNIWRVVLKTVVWGQMCIRDRNKAVESASVQLKKEKVDVKVVTRTVSSVAEVEALKKQNDQAIATAKGKVELNKALMAAYTPSFIFTGTWPLMMWEP